MRAKRLAAAVGLALGVCLLPAPPADAASLSDFRKATVTCHRHLVQQPGRLWSWYWHCSSH